MAGRKPLVISARQFEVLGLLWDQGPMTVRELLEHLPGGLTSISTEGVFPL
jgi:hypothetical protein